MKYVVGSFVFFLFSVIAFLGYLKYQETTHLNLLKEEVTAAAQGAPNAQGIYNEIVRLSREHRFAIVNGSVKMPYKRRPTEVKFVVRSQWLPIDLGAKAVDLSWGNEAPPSEPMPNPDGYTTTRPEAPSTSEPPADPCKRCGGTGYLKIPGGYQTCRACAGTGKAGAGAAAAASRKGHSSGMRKCMRCGGDGWRRAPNGTMIKCDRCDGTGRMHWD